MMPYQMRQREWLKWRRDTGLTRAHQNMDPAMGYIVSYFSYILFRVCEAQYGSA